MADENQAVTLNVSTTESDNSAAHSTEAEARESGWVPKEEYHGDANKWVDADEFVRRGPLFQKIDTQTRELKEVKKALAQLAQHHTKVRETEYKRALEDLKAQKKDAFIEGDADKIIAIDEKIDLVKDQQRTLTVEQTKQAQAQATETHPEFQAWTNRNPWYTNNAPMKAFADALGTELAAKGLRPAEVLKEVEKQVKVEFPQRFSNPNRDKPGAVEGTSKGSSSARGYQPTSLEREIAQRFVRQGIFKSEQDYYKELKDNS